MQAPILETAAEQFVALSGYVWAGAVGAAVLGLPAWYISGKPNELWIAAALGAVAGLMWFHRQVTK